MEPQANDEIPGKLQELSKKIDQIEKKSHEWWNHPLIIAGLGLITGLLTFSVQRSCSNKDKAYDQRAASEIEFKKRCKKLIVSIDKNFLAYCYLKHRSTDEILADSSIAECVIDTIYSLRNYADDQAADEYIKIKKSITEYTDTIAGAICTTRDSFFTNDLVDMYIAIHPFYMSADNLLASREN